VTNVSFPVLWFFDPPSPFTKVGYFKLFQAIDFYFWGRAILISFGERANFDQCHAFEILFMVKKKNKPHQFTETVPLLIQYMKNAKNC